VLAVHAVSVAAARTSALKVLGRVRKDGAFSGAALTAELHSARLSADDTALTTHLVYGVLGTQGVLDDAIDRFARGKIEPRIRDVLRLAAYELLYGRSPVYAVVDQAVAAARLIRPQAAGLVNAVAHRLADAAPEFPWGDPQTDLDALARVCGCPRWIVDEYLDSLGPARGREALLASAEPAPSFIRLDPFMATRESALSELAPAEPLPAPPDPDCFMLGRPAAAHGGTGGAWFSMDAAAQIAPAAAQPIPGARILDAGAGRGNKTVCLQAIAVRGGGPARITALELHAGKAARLRERLDSSCVPEVSVTVGDAAYASTLFGHEAFDTVVLDAPCTGLGTLRRYPEKRWRITPDDVRRMAALQSSLLEGLSEVVRTGGRLVYSTCSVARTENEAVVRAFLDSTAGAGFMLEPHVGIVPDVWSRFLNDDGVFQSWPATQGPDGHFVAVLRRNDA
jgi:16S rRNA (cytosine967-C5)-methyltransferase